jgi:hypothetical protein
MDNEIVNRIKELKNENEELKIDLSIAEELCFKFKKQALRIPKLEAEILFLRGENALLTEGRKKIMKVL